MKNLRILLVTILTFLLMNGLLYGQEYWQEWNNGIYYDDGNVGIGTDEATEKLTVDGNIKSGSPNSNKIYFRFLQSPNSNLHLDAASNYDIYLNHYNGNNIRFGPSGNWMFIKNNGNVGIGISDPQFALHVKNNACIEDYSPQLILKRNTATGGFIQGIQTKLNDDTDNWFFGAFNTAQWRISKGDYDDNPFFVIDDNGKVGIGTTNPIGTFHVEGGNAPDDIKGSDIKMISQNGGDAADIIIGDAIMQGEYGYDAGNIIISTGNGGEGSRKNGSGGNILLLTGTGYKNGAVGIGTSNPSSSYKLSVKGKIRAEEVIVETGWSDFVFEDDYNLMPIDEVADYIEINNHLPGIPSENEVMQNGVCLGQMQSKLLQKVEELTLYMIEMKKENEELKDRIAKIESKN